MGKGKEDFSTEVEGVHSVSAVDAWVLRGGVHSMVDEVEVEGERGGGRNGGTAGNLGI